MSGPRWPTRALLDMWETCFPRRTPTWRFQFKMCQLDKGLHLKRISLPEWLSLGIHAVHTAYAQECAT